MMGARTQAQRNCQNTEGHHSQPVLPAAACSAGVPWVSVPSIPKLGWNFLDTMNMKKVRKSYDSLIVSRIALEVVLTWKAMPPQTRVSILEV